MLFALKLLFSAFLLPSTISTPTAQVAIAVIEMGTALIGGGFAIAGKHSTQSTGTCLWFGTAPICDGYCPGLPYIKIRESGSPNLEDNRGNKFKDPNYGHDCYFWTTKWLCCKADHVECLWRGSWADSINRLYSCTFFIEGKKRSELRGPYKKPVKECGLFSCSLITSSTTVEETSRLYGERCERFSMFNQTARASCGIIRWFANDSSNEILDTWYKLQH